MQSSSFFLIALIFVAIVISMMMMSTCDVSAVASRRCTKPDCTDVIGEGLVKDNLGTAQHFTQSHHDHMEEVHRRNRIKEAKRGHIDPKDL